MASTGPRAVPMAPGQGLWSAAFPIDYRDVAVFSLLVIILTLRPGGLLGVRP